MAVTGTDRTLFHVVPRPIAGASPGLQRLRAAGWSVRRTADAAGVAAWLDANPHVAHVGVVDARAGLDATELAALAPALSAPNAAWVALVDGERLQDPVLRQLVRDYCLDYITVPVPDERLLGIVGHAHGMADLTCAAPQVAEAGLDGIVGSSPPMRRLATAMRKAARTDAPVFIAGETGTGKELAARALHALSPRASRPFVAINCGAIPQGLLQSELFGYERGAFTGAQQRKRGRIELADGGTLFLDEVGDLPLDSQAALLRFLQEGSLERLGGHETLQVDVRLVSATHHDLERAVAEGRFRADLYHRLCVLRLAQPPLRERGPDIERIAEHALRRYGAEGGRRIRGFSRDARRAMHGYAWPGNVRELMNRVRQAVVMSEGRLITAADLGLADAVEAPRTLEAIRSTAVRNAIERTLGRHDGRLAEAARELGVSRVTLYRLMQRHGLRPPAAATSEVVPMPHPQAQDLVDVDGNAAVVAAAARGAVAAPPSYARVV